MMVGGSAFAKDFNSRKGFVLGFGLGGGLISFPDSQFSSGATGGGLRIGAGLNEHTLLMAESYNTFFTDGFEGVLVSSWNVAAQFFLIDNHFYVRPGIGFATSVATSDFNEANIPADPSTGISAMLSSGYEFRLGRSFCLSPELNFAYASINSQSNIRAGIQLGLLWYFQ